MEGAKKVVEELIQLTKNLAAVERAKTESITINMDQFRDAFGTAVTIELDRYEEVSEKLEELLTLFNASVAARAWLILTANTIQED